MWVIYRVVDFTPQFLGERPNLNFSSVFRLLICLDDVVDARIHRLAVFGLYTNAREVGSGFVIPCSRGRTFDNGGLRFGQFRKDDLVDRLKLSRVEVKNSKASQVVDLLKQVVRRETELLSF